MKVFIIVVAVFSFLVPAKAQFVKSIGVSALYISASQTISPQNATPAWGKITPANRWGAQVDLNHIDLKYFSFSTVVGYTVKGAQAIRHTSVDRREENYHLRYLTYSPKVLVKHPFGSFIPYIHIGPRLDYFIGQTIFYTNSTSGETGKENYNYPGYKKLIFGLTGGVGAEKKINNNFSVGIEFNIMYDFTNAINTTVPDFNDDVGPQSQLRVVRKNQAYAGALVFRYYF